LICIHVFLTFAFTSVIQVYENASEKNRTDILFFNNKLEKENCSVTFRLNVSRVQISVRKNRSRYATETT